MKNIDIDINYAQELGVNYMVLGAGSTENDYARRMISENIIEGLLPMHTSYVDGEAEYYYEINGKLSLGQYFQKRTVEYEDLQRIIRAIVSIPERLDDFLLDKNNVLLGVDSTFLSSDGKSVYFCFYPGGEMDFSDGVRDIATFFLKKINHQDEKCTTMAYKIFEIACREAFSLDELLCENRFEGRDSDIEPNSEENSISELQSKEDLASELFDDVYNEFDFSKRPVDEDIFEGDFFEEKPKLPKLEEKPSPRENVMKVLPLIIPIIAFVIVAIFLFSSSMSDLSLALRIGCLFFVAIALTFIALIFKSKLDGASK